MFLPLFFRSPIRRCGAVITTKKVRLLYEIPDGMELRSKAIGIDRLIGKYGYSLPAGGLVLRDAEIGEGGGVFPW